MGGVCYPSMHCRWYPSMPCSRSPGGCYPSMHCRWCPSIPCSRSPGGLLLGGCLLLGGVCSQGRCLLWGGVAFCYALLLWPSGLAAFWYGLLEGPEGHNRRPPHQKATTKGGAWWRPPPGTATAAGRTHPTGMHSCLLLKL